MITEVKLFPRGCYGLWFVQKPEDMFIGEENFIEIATNLPKILFYKQIGILIILYTPEL